MIETSSLSHLTAPVVRHSSPPGSWPFDIPPCWQVPLRQMPLPVGQIPTYQRARTRASSPRQPHSKPPEDRVQLADFSVTPAVLHRRPPNSPQRTPPERYVGGGCRKRSTAAAR